MSALIAPPEPAHRKEQNQEPEKKRRSGLGEEKNDAEQETATSTKEKVEAIKSFAVKQIQITDNIEKIKMQADDLLDSCIASIEKYRQEISINQLIHDYPEAINYVDVKSITI